MNDRLRELGDAAVAELRAHGGLPALTAFLQATLEGMPDEPQPAPLPDDPTDINTAG